MKNIICIAPYGGLCNRLRVVASAFQYCIDKCRNTRVFWMWERSCNIKFHQLFYPIESNALFEVVDSNRLDMQWNRRFNFHLPPILRKVEGITDLGVLPYSWLGNGEAGFIPAKGNIYLTAAHYYYRCKTPLNAIFKPLPEVEDAVERVKQGFSTNTVGVHIRRTDNVDAIKTSPLEFFYEEMGNAIEQDSSINFFLATDDKDIKYDMKRRYGERILTYDAELSRGSNNGMKDALIELLCLSNTKRIVGSFNSSYNEFAAAYGNIELKLPGRIVTHDYLGFWNDEK